MATGITLKKNAQARIAVARALITAGDYTLAVEMLGFALEIALKSCVCKTLCISVYPDNLSDKEFAKVFRTHNFDQLLLLSGMQSDFALRPGNKIRYRNWSKSTTVWDISQRYDPIDKYTKEDAVRVLNAMTRVRTGVITWIDDNNKW